MTGFILVCEKIVEEPISELFFVANKTRIEIEAK